MSDRSGIVFSVFRPLSEGRTSLIKESDQFPESVLGLISRTKSPTATFFFTFCHFHALPSLTRYSDMTIFQNLSNKCCTWCHLFTGLSTWIVKTEPPRFPIRKWFGVHIIDSPSSTTLEIGLPFSIEAVCHFSQSWLRTKYPTFVNVRG